MYNCKEHKLFFSAVVFLSLEIKDIAAGGKRLRQAPKDLSLTFCGWAISIQMIYKTWIHFAFYWKIYSPYSYLGKTHIFVCVCIYPHNVIIYTCGCFKMELLNHMAILFYFLRNCHTVSSAAAFSFLTGSTQWSQSLHTLGNGCCFLFSGNSHSDRCGVILHYDFASYLPNH